MHLSGVLPFPAEDVDHFAARIHLVVFPAGYTRYRLVARLTPFELVAGYYYVGGEEF